MKELSIEEKAKAYDKALRYAMIYYKEGNEDMKMMMKTCFPALVEESEDERIRKAITEYLRQRLDRSPSIPAAIGSWIAWLEKQGESSDQIHYWTEEEIEPIISDYLRGAEHYGGMIGRLRCLKPKSLEKQGETSPILSNSSNIGKDEQKPTIEMKSAEESLGVDSNTYNEIVDECIYGDDKQKPADKVKTKFKVGDWVVQGCNILKIKCVGNTHYCYETVGGYVDDMLVSEIDSLYHLWTIQDAKEGDVLSYQGEMFILKDLELFHTLTYYCCYDGKRFITNSLYALVTGDFDNIKPATKEQRDLLFQKMHEAGYEWDVENKQLKEIEQKTDWSNKEKLMLNDIIEATERSNIFKEDYQKGLIDWLKSLKDRVLPQPKQEWSEEDEKIALSIEQVMNCASLLNIVPEKVDKIRTWLKSLKQRIGG